ncbi:thioredoxin domain-containing protein 11 [Spea bombifrons]|uniref:thioredoxin domain-containing protein 11 n=1 Tax=Spea bombifrons TaxID=233779 RepID=UPI0023494592|nr:thioredoxin domain-containing protein 11 [Spea bombifrons]
MLRPVWQHFKRLFYLMGHRPKLLCGAIALSCALIVALRFTCSRAKDVVMPARPPERFFPTGSPVVDLFRGQLDYAEHIRQDSEITLFFLYAPWCGQSIAARSEIEQVANQLSDQVLFVAVNCWWHQGKCRKQKNFFYYPVINLYHKSFGPIEYKGPVKSEYIEKFVRRVMSPLEYIPSLPRLQDFLSNYEPGVLGYFEFNASPQPPGYLTFFVSALHSLQKDYVETVRFGVITDGKLAKQISLTTPGSVYLHRNLNFSLIYPDKELNFTAANICKWALDNRETLLRWLRPHGGKSLLLDGALKKGPALLLFMPFNPLAEKHPILDEITDVALKYNTCTRSLSINDGIRNRNHLEPFMSSSDSNIAETYRTFSCCNTVVLPQGHEISGVRNVCDLCISRATSVRPSNLRLPRCSFTEIEAALDSFYLKEHIFMHFVSAAKECSDFSSFYSPFNHYSACCQTIDRGTYSSKSNTENFSLTSHWKSYDEDSSVIVPHIEEEKISVPHSYRIGSDSITGLRCRTNKTLHFYLLDANLSWLYAQRLGASGSGHGRTFAAIVDMKEETHYVLDQRQPLVKSTLEAFIQNFSQVYSPLQRHLVSKATPSEPAIITEVTSSTFKQIVLETKKDVLLLYYTTWCGFCSSLNHIFLRLTQLLATDSLIVARINIAHNDLPWEFMVDRVPTILFYPQRRKDYSVKFPDHQQITLQNLLKFILKYTKLPSSTAVDPPASCPKEYLRYKEDHVSYLEREILRLRAEIELLHKAQHELAGHFTETRKDTHDLKVQKLRLEHHNKALEVHKEQLQALYEQKAREVGTMADKMKELAAASETLLAENALLKLLMASLESKSKPEAEKEKIDNPEDGEKPILDHSEIFEGASDNSITEELDPTNESRTD